MKNNIGQSKFQQEGTEIQEVMKKAKGNYDFGRIPFYSVYATCVQRCINRSGVANLSSSE